MKLMFSKKKRTIFCKFYLTENIWLFFDKYYCGIQNENSGIYLKVGTLRKEYFYFGYYKQDEEDSCNKWVRSFGFGFFHVEFGRLLDAWLDPA